MFRSNLASTWTVASPASVTATLMLNGTLSWKLVFQDGEQMIFDYASGSLTAIVDRNGNTTQLSYDTWNCLVTVSDPAGRHLHVGYENNLNTPLVTKVRAKRAVSVRPTAIRPR